MMIPRQAGVPESPGHLAFMTTTIAAGTVGSEFYMTRGHYHVQDSGDMYLGLSGHGIMVMESAKASSRTRPSHRQWRFTFRPAGFTAP